MAPGVLETGLMNNIQVLFREDNYICSDPLVVPSSKSSRRTKELWWLHGHPHSRKYANPKLQSLAALVRHDGAVYQGQKAFLYPISVEPTTPYASMTWDEFDCVTETIALSYAYQLEDILRQANQTRKQPTVALLGTGKSLDYFCTQLALQKLGLRVLLLAESNSRSTLRFLVEKCEVLSVIVDSKNACTDMNGVRKIHMIESIPKSSKISPSEVDAIRFQDYGDLWERHTFIIHSSGSTGTPKPIVHTNRSLMLIARMYRLFPDFDVENWFLLFPLYHIAGISIALSGLPNGQILSFPPISWPPSASSLFKTWETLSNMGHKVDCVHCAPTLIENMYDYILDNGADFAPLVSLKVLQPGGAVLAESILTALTSQGVNIKTTYGTTETGPSMRSMPHTRNNSRCYSFRNLYPDNPFIKMEQVAKGVYECVFYRGFELAADLWQGNDKTPYRTNDLFIQDPPGSGYYIMQGRKDDILVHTNGENTPAGPLQLDIQTSSKIIKKCLALGHALPCVSLLVELHEDYDPEDIQIQNKIWQQVKKINARYLTHSHIIRPMIYILPKRKTLPVTPKGNVRRAEAQQLYASEIKQLYSQVTATEKSTTNDHESLTDFLRTLLAQLTKVPRSQITDTASFYELGIDSRLALSMRISLSKHLTRSVSLSNIFENPSISQLVSFFMNSDSKSSHYPKRPPDQITRHMIDKLESEFHTWPTRRQKSNYPPIHGEIVLLTGSTGSLGTALLETLSASSSIRKIYAMVRGPNHRSKLASALSSRGIDTSLLSSPTSKIHILNLSMQDPLLGLDVDIYHHLAETVTLVVQNAWKMDFNKGVEEFEADCLRSTMSLLRLCHAGRPKKLAFMSSVSACMGPAQIGVVREERAGNDTKIALPTGYAQSKYIAERILDTASRMLEIPVKLLRVGQLCGSTRTGCWNTNEMFPIMFATALCPGIKAFPVLEGKTVDWVPVDIAASVISEIIIEHISSSSQDLYEVHNIVNPHPIRWSSLMDMLQSSSLSTTTLEEVSMEEWVRRLSVLADEGADANTVTGLRLLGFFEDMVGEGESKKFETDKSEGISASLRELKEISQEWLEGYLGVWQECGFLRGE